MLKVIQHWLVFYGINEKVSLYLSNILAVIGMILVSMIIDLIMKKIVLRIVKGYITRSSNKWDDLIWEYGVFERLARIAPAFVIYVLAPVFPKYEGWIQRLAFAYMVFILIVVFNKLINAGERLYWKVDTSRTKPIKGYLQVLQMFVSVMGVVIIISGLLDKSPKLLLSGIGAATAVLLLIFQDSILGLVASVQLSSNDMVKIGDWISMPEYGADGDILEISLNTVKVQNWDKTIVTIPPYALISKSFVNWRGMVESGGRRIKRSIYIDMSSITFCTEEMLGRFKKIEYIQPYLDSKKKEIESYNKAHHINETSVVNGRRLTNIGTFRAYVEQYLHHHPGINPEMTQMVRQLQPTENGLPIEIYAFTNDTAWVTYEGAQSDIFDHILAVIPQFDLRVYQAPSGHDFTRK